MRNVEKWYRQIYLQRRNKDTDENSKYIYQGGKGGWDEMGDWDSYIYIIDTMCKIGTLEEEMATQFSIIAWKIPWAEESGGYSPKGQKESDTTEWLNTHIKKITNENLLSSMASQMLSGKDSAC